MKRLLILALFIWVSVWGLSHVLHAFAEQVRH
jgi:hypothetical protein